MRPLVVIVVALAGTSYAATPFVATRDISLTFLSPDGRVLKQSRSQSQEMRAANGAQRYQEGPEKWSLMTAPPSISSYTIAPAEQRAVLNYEIPASAWKPTPREDRLLRATQSKGTKIIAGQMCHLFPLQVANAASLAVKLEGTICHDLEHDIVLEDVREWTQPDGSKSRRVVRLTELRLGVEPPPDSMRVPPGFAIAPAAIIRDPGRR